MMAFKKLKEAYNEHYKINGDVNEALLEKLNNLKLPYFEFCSVDIDMHKTSISINDNYLAVSFKESRIEILNSNIKYTDNLIKIIKCIEEFIKGNE